jgi:hypothetical protein
MENNAILSQPYLTLVSAREQQEPFFSRAASRTYKYTARIQMLHISWEDRVTEQQCLSGHV